MFSVGGRGVAGKKSSFFLHGIVTKGGGVPGEKGDCPRRPQGGFAQLLIRKGTKASDKITFPEKLYRGYPQAYPRGGEMLRKDEIGCAWGYGGVGLAAKMRVAVFAYGYWALPRPTKEGDPLWNLQFFRGGPRQLYRTG